MTMQEAKEIMRRLGPEEQKFAVSISAPLYWEGPRRTDGTRTVHNGTAFFLKTAKATFGVTAAHVVEGPNSWRAYCEEYGPTPLRLSGTRGNSVELPFDARCVDMNLEIDIATFMIPEWEIEFDQSHCLHRLPARMAAAASGAEQGDFLCWLRRSRNSDPSTK